MHTAPTRRLRLGILGGGPESWIGRQHRGAAVLDGRFEVVAGVFSSDAERSRAAGRALGLEPGRAYGAVEELVAAEARRPDGIEAVAIMTPNDAHYPQCVAALDAGLHVMCDKPVTTTLDEARDLRERVRRGNRAFCIAHGYSAYPMTRWARHLVREDALGPVRLVQVEYIQSGMATRLEDAPRTRRLAWLLDPSRGGLALVMGVIGVHAEHLAGFVSGLAVESACADLGTLMPGREVIDYASALVRYAGGARGTYTVTQAAAGAENDIRLRVYGEKGMLEWWHREPGYLRLALQGEPVRTYGKGDTFLPPEVLAYGRTPRGHPEGLREAFANLYADFADDILSREAGGGGTGAPFPGIDAGVASMAFIEACVASSRRGGGWIALAR